MEKHLLQSCARKPQRRAKVWGNAGACRIQLQLRCIMARTVSAAAVLRHCSRVLLPLQHVCCYALSYLIVNCRKHVRHLCRRLGNHHHDQAGPASSEA